MTPHGQLSGRTVAPWVRIASPALASALVFWLFDSLPFQDLPAHGGLIALRHRFATSPFEQAFFVLAPHLGPYSLFRFLGDVLVVPLGPLGAIRAIATLPVIATPFALLWARRTLHSERSPTVPYYGLALGFGFMTVLGFASYLLGVAALLVGLTAWLKLLALADHDDAAAAASSWRWELAVALAAPCIFLAHGHAFVIFLGLAAVSALATGRRWHRILRLRALGPGVALAGWVAWRERGSAVPAGSVPVPHAAMVPHFQGILDKLSLLLTPTLVTRTGLDAAVGVLVWLVTGAAVVLTARSLRARPDAPAAGPGEIGRRNREQANDPADEAESRAHSRALLACAAALAIAFAVLPHSIGWFGFVDGRLVPLILLTGLMAVRRPALGRVVGTAFDRLAPVAAWAMIAITVGASYLFQAEAAGWKDVLSHVPPRSRVLNLPLDPDSEWFTAHPFVHYDKLIVATRPTVVSDVWFHQGTGIYPTAENPALRLPDSYSESDLRAIDWPSYRLQDWDYVLIRTRPDSPMPKVPAHLALVNHSGGWWLFTTGEK